jgi:hypothetical protein
MDQRYSGSTMAIPAKPVLPTSIFWSVRDNRTGLPYRFFSLDNSRVKHPTA